MEPSYDTDLCLDTTTSLFQCQNLRVMTLQGVKKDRLLTVTGSVDGEKNAKNNVNNKLINICFNSKLTI
jgi:hypothetical protein